MANEIVKSPPPSMPFEVMEKMADYIAKSKLFGIATREQALTLMMISEAHGMHPMLAAEDYHIIHGRPSKKAEAMQRDFLGAGGTIEWHALDDVQADASFSHPRGGKVRITWDMERAKTAELLGNAMWKKYPRQMLRARTLSEGVRSVYPAATFGLYAPEEQHDMAFAGTTLDGEVSDVRLPSDATTEKMRPATTAPEQREAAQAAAMEQARQPAPAQTNGKMRSKSDFLTALHIAIEACNSAEECDRVITADDVLRAKEAFDGKAKLLLDQLITGAMLKWFKADDGDSPAAS